MEIDTGRIKRRRKLLGLTADELGERIGKNRATVYRYENGEVLKIPFVTLQLIADPLNTNTDYLTGITDDPDSKRRTNMEIKHAETLTSEAVLELMRGLSESTSEFLGTAADNAETVDMDLKNIYLEMRGRKGLEEILEVINDTRSLLAESEYQLITLKRLIKSQIKEETR